MKTLVIHPFDTTTLFLSDIYDDVDNEKNNYQIIDTNVSKQYLKNEIKSSDRIIMLGHGTESGLIGYGRYVINSDLIYLLKDKICVCIWCNANIFVEKYKLKGLYSGMIISEYDEALQYSINTTLVNIQQSNLLFANTLKQYIDEEYSTENLTKIKNLYKSNIIDNPVINFNVDNIFVN